MKMATSEVRQAIFELAIDLQGPNRAVTDPAGGGRGRRAGSSRG